MKFRLASLAERDVVRILSRTVRLFGPQQASRYQAVMKKGIAILADDPYRPSSRARDDIAPGIRSFHLQLAARRRGGAAHILFYRVRSIAGETRELEVLRILSDTMEPRNRIVRAIREGSD